MQPKRSPLLIATAALGVLALGGLAFVFLQPSGPAPTPTPAQAVPTPVPTPAMQWVAAYDIPPRTRLTSNMLVKVPYSGKVPTDGIQNLADVQDELTNEPIMRGTPVTRGSLIQGIKRVVPANIEVPRGFRAVAIYVDPSSTAAGLVDVGDYVDVVAVHKLSWDKGKNQYVVGALQFSTGRLIGSGLKVLAVDKSLEAPPPTPTPVPAQPGQPSDAPGQGPPPTPTPPPAPTGTANKIRVLLAAPVETATRLIASGDQGVLNIIIRNPMDRDQDPTPEVREYPSHLITQRDPTPALPKVSSSGPAMPPMGMPPISAVPTLPPPAPTEPALPPAAAPTPSGPPTTDITVIRGTEKTRVIVPQR